jgi:Icc-related predicted phosphoesterase
MRIAYLSDLHCEFETTEAAVPFDYDRVLAPAAAADLIVLAGDVDIGERGVERANAIAERTGLPVVYVAGNHEFYGRDVVQLEPALRRAAWQTDGRVLYLNQNVVRFWFGGELLIVLGCTLWTDHALMPAGAEGEPKMSDYDEILYDGAPFKPAHAIALHCEHKAWLGSQMSRLVAGRTRPKILVVTHHAPIAEALGERAAVVANAYASDLNNEIAAWPPLVWIHGHTHFRHETRVGSSNVLSAPRGYPLPGEGAEDFVCGVLDV